MPDAVTDTHRLIWYLEDSPHLSAGARAVFDRCDRGESVIYVPTISLVEIIYLQEKGRIPADLKAQLDAALEAGTTGLILVSLTPEVVDAVTRVPRSRVPDMPDRIVAATALNLRLPLISRDRAIRLSTVRTVWWQAVLTAFGFRQSAPTRYQG